MSTGVVGSDDHNSTDYDTEEQQRPRLTGKQRAFVDHWFGKAQFNGTEAARLAGYQGDENTLAVAASRLLRNDKIKTEIAFRWEQHGITAEEVLFRLSEQARANIGQFLMKAPPDEEDEREKWYLDLEKVQEAGHLVKSLQWTRYGPKVDLYDAQGALQLIGKHLGLFSERVEHVGEGGGPIKTAVVILPDNKRGDGPAPTERADE